MNERLQPFLLTVLVAGLGLALALALRQSARPLPDARPAAIGFVGGTRFENVRVVGRADGHRAWVLTAPQVTSPQGRQKLEFSGGIEATLYQDDQPRAVCTAPRARYDSQIEQLVALGGVTLRLLPPHRAADNDLPPALGTLILTTETLEWKTGDKTLVCNQPVKGAFRNGEAHLKSLRLNLQTRAFDGVGFQSRFLVKDLDL